MGTPGGMSPAGFSGFQVKVIHPVAGDPPPIPTDNISNDLDLEPNEVQHFKLDKLAWRIYICNSSFQHSVQGRRCRGGAKGIS